MHSPVNLMESLRISDVASARALFRPLAGLPRETVAFAYLGDDERLLGIRHLAPGAADWARVPMREMARDAIAFDASAVVMAHNHPSGDATPSAQDLTVTRRIVLALEALGLRLSDHLVLAGDRFTSLRALGIL